MTREEFVGILDEKGYLYEIEGDRIIFNKDYYDIYLNEFKTIPPGVEFYNRGDVVLANCEVLPSGLKFNNRYNVIIPKVKIIHSGVEFNNRGNVKLSSNGIGYINNWEGNIEGIDSKRLLNVMISKGMFI